MLAAQGRMEKTSILAQRPRQVAIVLPLLGRLDASRVSVQRISLLLVRLSFYSYFLTCFSRDGTRDQAVLLLTRPQLVFQNSALILVGSQEQVAESWVFG